MKVLSKTILLSVCMGVSSLSYASSDKDGEERLKIKKQLNPYTVVLPGGYVALPPPDMTRDKVYEQQKYINFPLTPEEIQALRKKRLETERAKNAPLIKPKIQTRVIQFSFDAGAPMPVVHVAPGFVSSITFTDGAGDPWNISDSPIVGDGDGFQVTVPDKARNVLNISAAKVAGETTLSVLLDGKPVPIVIRLVISAKKHDARVDMVSGDISSKKGQDINMDVIPDAAVNRVMLDFVSGVPPKEAVEVKTDNRAIRAWILNDQLYLRTKHRLVSPGWMSEAHGVGVNVYQLSKTPWILYEVSGQIKTAKIDLKGAS